jgi:hypothetical protein
VTLAILALTGITAIAGGVYWLLRQFDPYDPKGLR